MHGTARQGQQDKCPHMRFYLTNEELKMGHKHAKLMALYAKDAEETVTPWLRWQYRAPGNKEWEYFNFDSLGPSWSPATQYRRIDIKEKS